MTIFKLSKMLKEAAPGGALLFFCSFLCISCISNANNNYIKKARFSTYDAIIVPGVPFEEGKWSELMKIRVYWAHHLYQQGIAKNIIFSGSAVYSPYIEGKIMATYAQEIGIPKEHIFVESRAQHSTENLYYSYKIAQENGFKKVALATDPFQSSFLRLFSNKIGLKGKIGYVPIAFKEVKKWEMITPEIDPSPAFVGTDFQSLKDRESFAVRWKGTMGKQIEYAEGDDPKSIRKKKRMNKNGVD